MCRVERSKLRYSLTKKTNVKINRVLARQASMQYIMRLVAVLSLVKCHKSDIPF